MTVTGNCMQQYGEAKEILIGMQHRNYYFSRMILWFFPHSFNFQFTNVQFIQFMEDWKKFHVKWILIFFLWLVSHTRQHLLASHLHSVLYAVLMPTFENTLNKLRQKFICLFVQVAGSMRDEGSCSSDSRANLLDIWLAERQADRHTNK